jgi:predicted dehydrogenase
MIRFATIGTNWITDRFIEAAAQIEDFKLNAVYSRTEKKASNFAEKYNIDNYFSNLEEMAASDLIDAVYIASPNSLHAEQSILFLENNKHVLCEKAIASNQEELKRMIETAKKNDLLLMEAMKSSFLPNYKLIENNIPELGRIRRVFFNYCQYSSRYDKYKRGENPNTFNPEFSNGALMDIGVYCIYPLINLFGMPESLQVESLILDSSVDGEGSIIFEYDSMDAVITYSKIADSYIKSEIQGEKANIVIDKIAEPEDVILIEREAGKRKLSKNRKYETMYYEIKHFIDLIKAGKTESPVNSYELTLKVMKIMDIIREKSGIIFPADN